MNKKPTSKNLEQQIGELTEALQRERADFVNHKSRVDERVNNGLKRGYIGAVTAFLPLIDSLFEAADMTRSERENYRDTKKEKRPMPQSLEALEKISKQALTILNSIKLKRIEIKEDVTEFDPRFHEALVMEGGAGEKEIVSGELIAGYKLGDEVIRPAMVKVKRG